MLVWVYAGEVLRHVWVTLRKLTECGQSRTVCFCTCPVQGRTEKLKRMCNMQIRKSAAALSFTVPFRLQELTVIQAYGPWWDCKVVVENSGTYSEMFNHDKRQKFAVSPRCLHWIFVFSPLNLSLSYCAISQDTPRTEKSGQSSENPVWRRRRRILSSL